MLRCDLREWPSDPMLITDPLFYLAAIPAVLLYGAAKGGLGGAAGALAVPLMTLAIDPITAAAILLPIICAMDIHVISLYRGNFDRPSIWIIVPSALIGVGVGALMMGTLSTDYLRILVGGIAVAFCLQYWLFRGATDELLATKASGYFWGTIAGFTSMHIHAGGPPVSVYLLSKKLDKLTLVGTLGVFFAVLNFVKLVPYTYLGQFDPSSLLTSLVLLPLAPIGVRIGYWIIHQLDPSIIYRAIYILLFISGAKLLYDGGAASIAAGAYASITGGTR